MSLKKLMNRQSGGILDQSSGCTGRVQVMPGQNSAVGDTTVLHEFFLRIVRNKTYIHRSVHLLPAAAFAAVPSCYYPDAM